MPSPDSSIWIVHRASGARTALARILAGATARHELILGGPHDSIFDTAPEPAVVVVGLGSPSGRPDFEDELEFARWASERQPGCAWILIAERADLRVAGRLFDTLDAELLPHPCDARTLLAAIRDATERRVSEPLSRRTGRDRLAARFSRWFGRDEPPNVARALDARRVDLPLLAAGEPGTGRQLVLRYAHAFSAGRPGPLLRIACRGVTRGSQLLEQIDDAIAEVLDAPDDAHPRNRLRHQRWGVWLEALDELPPTVQHRVAEWLAVGLPGRLPGARVRWLASVGPRAADAPPLPGDPHGLEPELDAAFADLRIDLDPLRSRPHVVAPFVADTARAWAAARRAPAPQFDEDALAALRAEPWPGNLAELEAVVTRTLASLDRDARSVGAADLRLDAGHRLASQPAPDRPDAAARGAAGPDRAPAPAGPTPAAAPAFDAVIDEAIERGLDTEPAAPADAAMQGPLQRLARAVAHEILNPLVPIRTLSQLLPDRWADDEFRTRFANLVGDGVRRIEEVVEQLQDVADAGSAAPERVDVTAMLESLLDAERERIQMRRLLVLKEFDRSHPHAVGDPRALRRALAGLVAAALDRIPDNGDFYLASRHHPAPAPDDDDTGATLRVLLRYPTTRSAVPELDAPPTIRDAVLDHAIAEVVVRGLGGQLSIDDTDATETVVVIDLPAS